MENKRHAVASRNLLEPSGGRRLVKFVRTTDGLIKSVHHASLLIGSTRGITDDIDKENVRDFQALICFRFLRHQIQT